jgi:hypothetical protein
MTKVYADERWYSSASSWLVLKASDFGRLVVKESALEMCKEGRWWCAAMWLKPAELQAVAWVMTLLTGGIRMTKKRSPGRFVSAAWCCHVFFVQIVETFRWSVRQNTGRGSTPGRAWMVVLATWVCFAGRLHHQHLAAKSITANNDTKKTAKRHTANQIKDEKERV